MNGIRRIVAVLVLGGLPWLVAGCNKAGGGSARGTITEVRLGYFANVTHAQAVLGVSSGEFQKALGDVKLTPRVFEAGPALISALNSGAIDIGYVGPGPVIVGFNNSQEDLRVISGAAANGVVIVARADANIHSPKDLAGKLIATPQYGNTQDIACRHYLKSVLGQTNLDNVRPLPNIQQLSLMSAGKIDAAWEPEPWASRLVHQAGGVVVAQEKDLETWPAHEFSLTVIATTPEFLAAHRDIVEKILGVHHAWTVRLASHPQDYAGQLGDALAGLTNQRLAPEVIADSLNDTLFTDDPLPRTFDSMAGWAAELNFIPMNPSLAGLFDAGEISKITAGH